jgi:hypothetical protein
MGIEFRNAVEDDFSGDFEDELRDKFSLEEDSMEHYLWRVEAMLIRVAKLRNHLATSYSNGAKIQCSPGPANVSLLVSGSPRTLNTESSPKAHGSSSMARRRICDSDINNLIMPDNVMANYVEPAWHAFIQTPHWRVDEHTSIRWRVIFRGTDLYLQRCLLVKICSLMFLSSVYSIIRTFNNIEPNICCV